MAIIATTPLAGMHAHAVPAFADNYIWLLQSGADAIVLDPGDDAPINRALAELGLTLRAILITHHHPDHIGRLAALASRHPCPVYGPRDARIDRITQFVDEGDVVSIAGFPPLAVWHVPGHTRSHIAYRSSDAIFVGDTLFGAGCGRVFEGEPATLFASLQRIGCLPETTQVFCSHEYTRANLGFADAVEPGNPAIAARRAELADGRASVPFRIAGERASNVFLRCDQPEVVRAAERHVRSSLAKQVDVFAALRLWKNTYA